MADATTVVEGKIKFREGKKWKPRWCVLKKPSPVAGSFQSGVVPFEHFTDIHDRLQVVLYKDVNEFVKNEAKPKAVFPLDAFFGLDAGFTYDREPHVLAIICQKHVTLMAFELRETMIQFEIKIRQSLGEENQFPVRVVKAPSNSRLPKEQVCLMIHDLRFCLIAQSPPKILLSWNIEDLRRFGTRDGKFCFEGGTRCGKGSGVFALQSEQAEDIADIVNLAAMGKMSNCHRKFKNRSSQIDLGSHLIADMSSSPSSSSIHHPSHQNIAARAPPQGALPSTLNCCHDNQTGSAESEDWSWYKRHSVSVMDHRRISALREKGFLENRDQLVMGIYDVPPNHGRKLEDNIREVSEESNYAYPRPDPENISVLSSNNNSSCSTPVTVSTTVSSNDYGNYKKIIPKENPPETAAHDDLEHRQSALRKRQSASAEFFDSKVSSLDEILAKNAQDDLTDNNSHEESLQRLRKQESDLQREMVLLDEMLQNCEAKDDVAKSITNSESVKDEKMNNLNPKPNSKAAQNESLLGSMDEDFTIISGNITPLKQRQTEILQTPTPKKMDRTTMLRLNTSMPEGTPISPLFHAKLNNIPPTSRLNAPLPYVNLSKYDDESNSHVHLPGSADCVPMARGSQMLGHSGGGGLRGHSFSLTSLHTPVAASSLININQTVRDQIPSRNLTLEPRLTGQDPHSVPAGASFSEAANASNQACHQPEILVVKMENQPRAVESISHPSGSVVKKDGQTASSTSSDLVSLLTTDAARPFREEKRVQEEELYENLPLIREDTPPPALPPKGPALLKKIKAASADGCRVTGNANLNMSGRSLNPFGQETNRDMRSYGYDNQPRQIFLERDQERKNDTKEDNYLIMGSPKIKHKAPTLAESGLRSHISLDTTMPISKNQFGKPSGARDDYMDMGVKGADGMDITTDDDDIYLDVDGDQAFQPRDLYISEGDLKKPPSINNSHMLAESTYMEMGSVPMKSTVIQNLETLQTYVNKTVVGEKENTQSAILAPPPPAHPPRPVSLKVRHNSDSGITMRCGATDSNKPSPKPAKSPTKVYTKAKKSNQQQTQVSEPPMPFPNLIDFTKKMSESRSTYVNTLIDADRNLVPQENPPILFSREVPLPEPIKEGFLARFKRRSSKDKNACQVQEKSNSQKNRNSVLERSMSEHDSTKAAKEEKSSRLKLGRRRSSSFPNRLSYQESVENLNVPGIKHTASSSGSFNSTAFLVKPGLKQADQSESSSSVHDLSDDSDMSPLLKRGDKRVDARALTVLHVQRSDQIAVNPYMQAYKSPCKSNPLQADSSKTDDEKLIEMIQKKGQTRKMVVYQRSSSLELKKQSQEPVDQTFYLKLSQTPHRKERRFSFEKLMGCSSSSTDIPCIQEVNRSLDSTHYSLSDQSRTSSVSSSSYSLDNMDDTPPALPPKQRHYQGPLSPVIETAPQIPTLNEPVYVEIDEVLSMKNAERAKQKKKNAQSTLHNQTQEEKDGSVGKPETDFESKAGRSIRSENEENVSELNYTTQTVPVDITPEEQSEIEARLGIALLWCQSDTDIINDDECTSPAKSVLRPRSGQEYVLIQRRSVTTPISSISLPSQSPSLRREFNFDSHVNEAMCHHHHHRHHHQHHHGQPGCNSLSVCSHSPSPTPQKSPSISSAAETSHSHISLHGDHWDREPRCSHPGLEGKSHVKSLTATPSPASSPHPVLSHRPVMVVSPAKDSRQKSAHTDQTDTSIFFPMNMSFSASPPSSPAHTHNMAHSSPQPHIHCPIYVNQEFVDKHFSASCIARSASTSSSQSSASPLRAGVHSLMSLFFKDIPARLNSSSESHTGASSHKKGRTRSGLSESDANRIDKHSLSLPSARPSPNLSLPVSVQRSHSDPKKTEKGERPALKLVPETSTSSMRTKVHQKEYDKFANSSIISRRRLQSAQLGTSGGASSNPIDSTAENISVVHPKDPGLLQVPGMKSSGYKNIDCFNAAAANASPSPKSLSTGPDASHMGQTSQLENITESQNSPNRGSLSLDSSPVFLDVRVTRRSSVLSSPSTALSDTVTMSMPLPHSSSPPPPLPRRKRLSSSPPSSPSLTPGASPSDLSDSPPSYFAPPPPSTPPPPALPPRQPLLPPPSPVAPSTPSEPDIITDSSEEEQELNYIEIDMTKSSIVAPPPQPLSYSRRSKRLRQKNKDYAKLRYAEIDHTATKALQQARQEHELGRDASLRHGSSKEGRSGQLSRINSAPASSKRKPLSLIPRERKLSSGSIESC